jgi:cytochrome c oxidase subunit 3
LLKRRITLPGHAITIEVSGLYWHLVDIVWVLLYPILYLAR